MDERRTASVDAPGTRAGTGAGEKASGDGEHKGARALQNPVSSRSETGGVMVQEPGVRAGLRGKNRQDDVRAGDRRIRGHSRKVAVGGMAIPPRAPYWRAGSVPLYDSQRPPLRLICDACTFGPRLPLSSRGERRSPAEERPGGLGQRAALGHADLCQRVEIVPRTDRLQPAVGLFRCGKRGSWLSAEKPKILARELAQLDACVSRISRGAHSGMARPNFNT